MPEPKSLTTISHSAEETQRLGRSLGPGLMCGDLIALHGDLGAGKTCLVQGLAQGMAVLGRVASPTFIIMRCHTPGCADAALYHVDAYRLESGEELWEMGLEDWLYNGVVAVEWAERVEDSLPAERLDIHFKILGEERELTLIAYGVRFHRLLGYLQTCGF